MSPIFVFLNAFLLAVQVFLLALWSSPLVAACAVFTLAMFVITFASWRDANR